MREKDYYEILEVEPTADECDIRAAFRRLAKIHHPDLSGSEETRRFREILKAYTVLSDPKTRASYDESLQRRDDAVRVKIRRSAHPQSTVTTVSQPSSPSPNVRVRRSAPGDTPDLFFRDHIGGRRSRGGAPVDIEVILSREEARWGGILPLLPAGMVKCPACRGAGHTLFFRCTLCYGQGVVENENPVRIRIPAGIRDGSVLQIPVQSHGTTHTTLRILIRVSDIEMSHGFY